jgi:hypothetical protein
MKKIKISLVALGVIALMSSCSKDDIYNIEEGLNSMNDTTTITLEEGGGIEDDSLSIGHWEHFQWTDENGNVVKDSVWVQ